MADKYQSAKPVLLDDLDDTFKYIRENFGGLKNVAGGYCWAQDTPGTTIGIDSCNAWFGDSLVEYSGELSKDFGVSGEFETTAMTANYYNKMLVTMDSAGSISRIEGTEAPTAAGVVSPSLPIDRYPFALVTVQDDGTEQNGTILDIDQSKITQLQGSASFADYIRSILTTKGDLVVRGGTVPEALAAVVVGQVLKSAGENTIPAYGVPNLSENGIATGNYTTSGAGDEVVSGLEFQPSIVMILAADITPSNKNWSVGIDWLTARACLYHYDSDVAAFVQNSYSYYIRRAAAEYTRGLISAITSDGFTITTTVDGAVQGEVMWVAIG